MSLGTFSFTTKDLESNKTQLKAGFQILDSHQDVATCINDASVFNFFDYLFDFTQANYSSQNVAEICEFFIQHNFYLQLIKLDEYFSKNCERLKINNQDEQDKRMKEIFCLQQSIINFLLAYSTNFSEKYFVNGGHKHILNILRNDVFYINFHATDTFKRMLVNMTCMPTLAHKSEWAELNAVDIFLNIASKDKTFKRSCYGVVIKIADDTQITKLSEMDEIVSIFIKSITKAANEIDKTESSRLKRDTIEYDEEEDMEVKKVKKFDVFCVKDDYDEHTTFPITGVLNSLYILSVNDKIKYDLYVKYNLKDPLKVIIIKGFEIEKRFGLKLLAQLCFDSLVLGMVSRDLDFVKYIGGLALESNLTKGIAKYCKQILFSINHKNNQELDSSLKRQKQVMISYNAGSRDLCIKMKNELEKAGYKVWIDIDEIHGSSLDSMANAVETSEVILMCVTENYRQSVNCQAEAQYAFKLKKPIIPLIMQKGYESVGGWLGMIMGDKIYISFIKYAYEEAISRLKSQLVLLVPNINVEVTDAKVTTTIPSSSTPQTKNVTEWSEEEVSEWFRKDGIIAVYDHIKPCDGEMLHQLYEMKQNAPEFFYQFVCEITRAVNNKLDGRSILIFTKNLQKLFQK